MATETWLCVKSILYCTDCGYILNDKDSGQDNVFRDGRGAMTYHFNIGHYRISKYVNLFMFRRRLSNAPSPRKSKPFGEPYKLSSNRSSEILLLATNTTETNK